MTVRAGLNKDRMTGVIQEGSAIIQTEYLDHLQMVDETDKGSHAKERYRGSRFRRRAELIAAGTNADREEFLVERRASLHF